MNNSYKMVDCMGGMMWPMGLAYFLAIVLLILAAASLLKYLFSGKK